MLQGNETLPSTGRPSESVQSESISVGPSRPEPIRAESVRVAPPRAPADSAGAAPISLARAHPGVGRADDHLDDVRNVGVAGRPAVDRVEEVPRLYQPCVAARARLRERAGGAGRRGAAWPRHSWPRGQARQRAGSGPLVRRWRDRRGSVRAGADAGGSARRTAQRGAAVGGPEGGDDRQGMLRGQLRG